MLKLLFPSTLITLFIFASEKSKLGMIPHGKVWTACASLMLLVGCAGFQLGNASEVSPTGSPFQTALYEGYLTLAETEFAESDFRDSDLFALRAMNAAARQQVLPQSVQERNLTPDAVSDLSAARERLMKVLQATAAAKAPAQAARAQVMFDCWMEEQEENHEPGDIAACRSGFSLALDAAEQAVAPESEPAPEPAPAPQKAATPEVPRTYLVFFAFDSASLTTDGQRAIRDAATSARLLDVKRLILTGHADRAGTENYNLTLSRQRANAVRAEFAKIGIPVDDVTVLAKGESEPLLPTPDGVREPRNRRVEIVLQ